MTHPEFPLLFSPLRLGQREARNRIVSTSHGTNMAVDSAPTDQLIAYHARKARGGCGVVMMFGSASPTALMPVPSNHVNVWMDSALPGLRRAAEAVRAEGALALCQLRAYGRHGSAHIGRVGYGPSDTTSDVACEVPKIITTAEITQIVDDHADACRRLAECGYDGVDISFYADSLPDEFWSPAVNRRTDRYGGSLENRMRFSVEILAAIRNAVGSDFIVGARVSGDDRAPGGLSQPELLEIIELLDATGLVDYFTVTGGTTQTAKAFGYNNPSAYYPEGVFVDLAAAVKARVRVPVIAVGRITTPARAEDVLRSGGGDMVGMTRALIADPDLPRKAESGNSDRVRICMGSSEGCIDRLYWGLPITCVQNPVVGREREWDQLEPSPVPGRVIVVGGGPAGMETARVAAERGHLVTLYDANDHLGGAIRLASRFPAWGKYSGVVDWLERELGRLDVDVRLNTSATTVEALAGDPTAVVVATGAEPRRPYIDGFELPHACTVADVISGRTEVGRRCVIVDEVGYTPALKLADHLAARGHHVEVISAQFGIGETVGRTLRAALVERLCRSNVDVTLLTRPSEVVPAGLMVTNVLTDEPRLVEADTVVFSSGGVPRDALFRELESGEVPVHVVGDAFAARQLRLAMADGARVGRLV